MNLLFNIALALFRLSDPARFDRVKNLVLSAEALDFLVDGPRRREWVKNRVGDDVQGWLVNLLIEVAVAQINKTKIGE